MDKAHTWSHQRGLSRRHSTDASSHHGKVGALLSECQNDAAIRVLVSIVQVSPCIQQVSWEGGEEEEEE